jgi:hypothetical protein
MNIMTDIMRGWGSRPRLPLENLFVSRRAGERTGESEQENWMTRKRDGQRRHTRTASDPPISQCLALLGKHFDLLSSWCYMAFSLLACFYHLSYFFFGEYSQRLATASFFFFRPSYSYIPTTVSSTRPNTRNKKPEPLLAHATRGKFSRTKGFFSL